MEDEELAGSQSESPADPPSDVLDVVNRCPLPALLLTVPEERILAASSLAEGLLAPAPGEHVVGRSFEHFMLDEPTDALQLMQSGRIDGYEARRHVNRERGPMTLTAWVRAVDTDGARGHAIVFLIPDAHTLGKSLMRPEGMTAEAVVGSTDSHVIVDRISTDVAAVLGQEPTDVVGRSLLHLVQPTDVVKVMRALVESVTAGLGTTVTVQLQVLGSAASRCHLLVLPMVPAPTFAFAFLHEEFSPDALRNGLAMSQALWQFGESVRRASASRLAGNQPPADLSTLSARELEIITRLMNGDRVPAIAGALFLSPSTVRNHLSAVFHKLGVSSQQELINLLRKGRIADKP